VLTSPPNITPLPLFIPHPHFPEPARDIVDSARRKNIDWRSYLLYRRLRWKFGCTVEGASIDLLAYVLVSIKQLLENLFIYFASDFVKYFRI
jgi:hypothetical protein